jgi:hypothetical protein
VTPPRPAAAAPVTSAPPVAKPPTPSSSPLAGPLSGAPRSATPLSGPRASSPTPASPPAPGAKKSINPFLANDPNLKARRLARALVSDMIAYLPGKREEGVRDGTLKALFKEEIKKSYEEYVDQIGKEFADTTTHFQEALNDLLAGGTKMF